MGKTLDDLKLDDTPIRQVVPASGDLRDQEWYQFSREIDALLGTGDYEWASATLADIQETVERTQHVTRGQRNAVHNIEGARRSRRYEGYGWRTRKW